MEQSELLRHVVNALEKLAIRISGDSLDLEYIEGWADNLGLETIWRTILRSSIESTRPTSKTSSSKPVTATAGRSS